MVMEEPIVVNKGDKSLDLPPGFRFHPTDEEIVICYLMEKVLNSSFSATAIGEADFNKCEPWDLPKKAKMGEKDWYFFCKKDRKYPTGTRTNRATQSGYWKATGKDKEIYKGKSNELVGMKKTLVFYRGRAPRGEKTNWVMHEFRLEGKFAKYNLSKTAKDEWVVSRVFHKNTDVRKNPIPGLLRINSISELMDCSVLPALVEPSYGLTTNKLEGYIDDDFKGTNQHSSPSDGYNLPSLLINNNQHQMLIKPENHTTYEIPITNPGNFSNPTGNILSQPQIQIQNASSQFQQNMYSDSYHMHQCNNNYISGLEKQCKMEKFPTNNPIVSVSQETCLSNDRNTDTSSVVSKLDIMGRNRTLYEDLEGPSSVGPLSDLECMWDDY